MFYLHIKKRNQRGFYTKITCLISYAYDINRCKKWLRNHCKQFAYCLAIYLCLTFMQSKLNVLKGGGNGGLILFEDSFERIRFISSWTVEVCKLNPSMSSRSTILLIFLCSNDLISLMTNLTTWAIFPYLPGARTQD